MNSNPSASVLTAQLLDDLLDRGYAQTTGAVLQAMTAMTHTPHFLMLQQQLEVEMHRLVSFGLPLSMDNPILLTFRAEVAALVDTYARLIDTIAGDVSAQGAQAGQVFARSASLPVSDKALAGIGVAWRTPDPEAIYALLQVTQSEVWSDHIRAYAAGATQEVMNVSVRGVVAGKNPLTIARELVRAAEAFPIAQANTLMRTLQLTSYRRAVSASYIANSDIITHHIRYAALDDRTCLSCIALHGTRLHVGESVADHHAGRCTSIAVVRGLERLTAGIEPGADWFKRLPEDRQLAIAGPGALELLQSGKATLRDFVQPYNDPVFGTMVRQGSLGWAQGERPSSFGALASSRHRVVSMRGIFDPSTLTAEAKHALNTINAIHKQAGLPMLRFSTSEARGVSGRLHPFGAYHRAGRTADLWVNSLMHPALKRSALTHEIGHALDDFALAATRGRSASRYLLDDPSMRRLMDAIGDSTEIQTLVASLRNPALVSFVVNRTRVVPSVSHIEYLLDPTEQFARAYQQFIARRSGDIGLMDIINQRRSIGGSETFAFWTDSSFAAIDEAMEALFRSRGWMP